jgi:uncharacterized protein YndB with AHSA1/START domain
MQVRALKVKLTNHPRRPFQCVRRIAAAGVLVFFSLDPAQAEVKDANAAGFTLENAVQVPADAMTTWRALVDDVDRWWPADHTWWGAPGELSIEARAGGCFCERYGEQQALHMLVTFVDPGKRLRLTGGLGPLQGLGLHGALEFRFAPAADGGTTITMFYRAGGYTPDDLSKLAPVVDKVQALQLGGLADYLRRKHDKR